MKLFINAKGKNSTSILIILKQSIYIKKVSRFQLNLMSAVFLHRMRSLFSIALVLLVVLMITVEASMKKKGFNLLQNDAMHILFV